MPHIGRRQFQGAGNFSRRGCTVFLEVGQDLLAGRGHTLTGKKNIRKPDQLSLQTEARVCHLHGVIILTNLFLQIYFFVIQLTYFTHML